MRESRFAWKAAVFTGYCLGDVGGEHLTTFGLATVALMGLLIAVTLLHRAPTRPCHRCGRRVRLEPRACPHSGYEFAPIRFGR